MKALILTGDKVQDHEFIYPYYRLKEEGAEVTVAMKEGLVAKGYLGTTVPPDKECTIIPYSLLLNRYDLVVLPGGAKCMEYLRQESRVLAFLREVRASGRVISSICHGAQLLISAKIVAGKRISGYYSIKDDIENAGATYINASYVIDGNLITCPHYKHMGAWMRATLEVARAHIPDQSRATL
jgi:protease I